MNITWKIDSLETKPQVDGFQDVVYTAHWRAHITDGYYTTSVYGSLNFNPDLSSSTFTAYEDLTEATVVGWVKEAMGNSQVETIESNLVSQIEDLKNPPLVTKPVPWST